jgi:hypothetical protein
MQIMLIIVDHHRARGACTVGEGERADSVLCSVVVTGNCEKPTCASPSLH